MGEYHIARCIPTVLTYTQLGSCPLVLLLHGFPEIWYSWRYQLPALAQAGFHAVAPDFRGDGDTEVPADATHYTAFHYVADLVGLVEVLGEGDISGWP